MRGYFSSSCLALILILCAAREAYGKGPDPAPSPVLAYQGRLIEYTRPATGRHVFVFSIVDSSGKELWNSGEQTLTVTDGIYGVVLGAAGMPALPSSLASRASLRLWVTADGVPLSPDVSLIPAFQASTAWSVIGPFSGDISGTQQSISVDKLKGTPIDLNAAPSSGQVLTFNGTSWIASAPTVESAGPPGAQGPQGATGPQGRGRTGHRERKEPPDRAGRLVLVTRHPRPARWPSPAARPASPPRAAWPIPSARGCGPVPTPAAQITWKG